jgi:hypothetical protein
VPAGRRWGRSEPPAATRWRQAEHVHECPPHGLGRAVPPARSRDLFDTEPGIFQQAASGLQAHGGEVLAGWDAGFGGEGPRALPGRQARPGGTGPDRSAARCSLIHCWTPSSGARRAACARRWALNCACPPGRRRYTTSPRATASAASRGRHLPRPKPGKIDARRHASRSAFGPSRMKIGSVSTITSGS